MDDIAAAAGNLRNGGGRAALIAISTDPEVDTRTSVDAFLHRHGGVSRWHYLSGSRARLEPVWKSYYVYAAPARAPAKIRDAHTSATYLIDPLGRWRGLFVGAFDPRTLARDLRILDGLPAQSSGSIEVAAQPGAQAPAFGLPALNGGTVRLSQYSGKVVLVNVWATWCLPCRQEMPLLQSTYRRDHAQGLTIIGIDRQEDRASVHTFVSRARVSYPIALDSSGSVTTRYIEACPKLGGIPDSILVDGSGTVAAVSCGQVDGHWLSQNVDKLLGLT
jgi:peroxiredoxin